MHAHIQIAPDSSGKRVDNSLLLRDGQEIYRQRTETYFGNSVNIDTGGRLRTSQTQTLFDGKIMNAEDTDKWDTKGSGSAVFTGNSVTLSVTAGQYEIRQSRFFSPYFSGKPQLIESTQRSFQYEAGVSKRFGYFSSNAIAPYDSDKDGWWVESDGTTYRLITSNNGVETHNIPWTEWDAYNDISSYDWNKFTVCMVDFLWLGGAGLRLFLVIDGQFKLVHTIANHAGYSDTLIFSSPNQPMRYEIRSTGGSGTFNTICSQVATEGSSPDEQGEGLASYSSVLNCNTVGTIYALHGVRKQAALRNHHITLDNYGASILTSDAGILMLLLNPTLSAPLTWANTGRFQRGVATTQTITNPGRVLRAIPMVSNSTVASAPAAALRTMACGIDNTMSELVLAYTPLTANQSVVGVMNVLEY